MFIHIFRRDLRIHDNVALDLLLKECKNNIFIPLFVFVTEQANPQKNPYFSPNSFRFMLESLQELHEELNEKMIFIDSDSIEKALEDLQKKYKKKIQGISWNLDYTPYAKKRDKSLIDWIHAQDHPIQIFNDTIENPEYTLFSPLNPKTLTESEKKGYRVYGAFFRKVSKIIPNKPMQKKNHNYTTLPEKGQLKRSIKGMELALAPFPKFSGGRKNGLKILDRIQQGEHADYGDMRDNMIADRTTGLSAYLKFGCVSIREAYWIIKNSANSEDLIKQLIWKEFYAHVVYHFPHVLKGSSMYMHFDECESIKDLWVKGKVLKERFNKWKLGITGVDIVDAAMNQLNTTGWMHNRGRMIVASFLVKDMHVDWREGERYFAQKLIDYDPANNNGGWQWVAGVGVDAAPYFRVFNPWLQEKRFDKKREYIEKYKYNYKINENEETEEFSISMHKERSARFVKLLKECYK
jgi:deoxyribodipyrimidine photo-lyase